MARNPPDPELVEVVLDYARTGMSHADIAEVLASSGLVVTAATVGSWCRKHGVKVCTAAPAVVEHAKARREAASIVPPTPPSGGDDDSEDDAGDDELAALVKMRKSMTRDAETARAVGNLTAAQRSMTAAATLAPVIARLRRAQKEDADVLHISKADIQSRMALHREHVRALLDRPLLCAECGRKLSVSWAESGSTGAEPDPKGAKK
jgi:hypothetical protein